MTSAVKQLCFSVPRYRIRPVFSSTSVGVQTDLYGDISISNNAFAGSWASIRSIIYLHGLASIRYGEKSEALLHKFVRDMDPESHQGISHSNCFTRFDFRGHGESTANFDFEHDFTVSGALDDVAAVLDTVDELLDSDMVEPSEVSQGDRSHAAYTLKHVLIGYSLGGLVAARYAASVAPHRVAALVLLAPGFGLWDRIEKLILTDINDGNGAALNVNRVCIPSTYVPEGHIVLGNRFIQDLREQWSCEDLESDMADTSFAQGICEHAIPVLVITGEEDDVVDWRLGARLVHAVEKQRKGSTIAKFVLLEGEDHRLNKSKDVIASEIEKFVIEAVGQQHSCMDPG